MPDNVTDNSIRAAVERRAAGAADATPSFVNVLRRYRRKQRRLRVMAGAATGVLVLGVAGAWLQHGQPRDEDTLLSSTSASSMPPGKAVATTGVAADHCGQDSVAVYAPEFVGLSEVEAMARAGSDTRVVGRDGQCLPTADDLRPNRVNLIVTSNWVVWAGRF